MESTRVVSGRARTQAPPSAPRPVRSVSGHALCMAVTGVRFLHRAPIRCRLVCRSSSALGSTPYRAGATAMRKRWSEVWPLETAQHFYTPASYSGIMTPWYGVHGCSIHSAGTKCTTSNVVDPGGITCLGPPTPIEGCTTSIGTISQSAFAAARARGGGDLGSSPSASACRWYRLAG